MFRRQRILVVDNSKYFSGSTWRALLPEEKYEVVGLAANTDEGTRLAASRSPDVVLVDLCQSKENGLWIIRALRQTCPQCLIIALTPLSLAKYDQAALEAGANISLEKSELATSLLPSLQALTKQQPYNLRQVWSGVRRLAYQTWSTIHHYVIYTGLGLIGGTMGATLAIAVAVVIQTILPTSIVFSPGLFSLIILTILMSFLVSWWLRHAAKLIWPRLTHYLEGQALQIVLVASIATGIMEALIFSRGWTLY